jgi:hypothetical protein
MCVSPHSLMASGIIQLVVGGHCLLFGIIEKTTTNRFETTITSTPCYAIWMGLWVSTLLSNFSIPFLCRFSFCDVLKIEPYSSLTKAGSSETTPCLLIITILYKELMTTCSTTSIFLFLSIDHLGNWFLSIMNKYLIIKVVCKLQTTYNNVLEGKGRSHAITQGARL